MDLLLADPSAKEMIPSWADYYLLLRFLAEQYDYLFVDLPELVNPATAEVVRSAGRVFVVCTPEIPSLRLAEQRCRELAAWGLPDGNVHILVNRMAKDGMSIESIQRMVGRPVFATIPNDYASVHESVLNSRLVDADTPFSAGCQQLARKAVGLQPVEQDSKRFSFLRRFSLAS
jgi:Flp pilus assembly CpaE family ATPase